MLRYQSFRILIFLLFCVLFAGLFHVQVLKGPYFYRKSEHNRIRLIPLLAPRGTIYDSNGVILAGNRPSYNVSVLPADLDTGDIPRISKILNLAESEIEDRLKRAKKVPFMPLVLARGVDLKTVFLLEELKPDLEGVLIQVESVRDYPLGESAAHLIGYVGRISKKELEMDDEGRFQNDDLVGRTGIEKGLDQILRGSNGGLQVEVDSRGRQTQVMSERKTKKGADVTLSIDIRLQTRIEALFGERRGAVGLMDLETGEIRAWVSRPSFDPNAFIDPQRLKERLRLLKDPAHPMIDRGARALYPPGSLFKIVTALAALEKTKINSHTTFFCNGFFRLRPGSRPFKCWYNKYGHQAVNIYKALERSCNVFFYNLGRMLESGEIAEVARSLGLGEPEEVEISYLKGIVPDENWKKEKLKDRWYQGETVSYAIGQGYLALTPLELLRMIGTVALESEMPVPHFVKRKKPARKKVTLNPENVKIVKRGLYKVVQSDFGTGQYARVPFMEMAGKTGTAQAARGDDHAWFGGFFPYEKPKVAFIVFVEHGRSGGMTSAKMMRDIAIAWHEIMSPVPRRILKTPPPEPPVQPIQPIQGQVVTTHVSQ